MMNIVEKGLKNACFSLSFMWKLFSWSSDKNTATIVQLIMSGVNIDLIVEATSIDPVSFLKTSNYISLYISNDMCVMTSPMSMIMELLSP